MTREEKIKGLYSLKGYLAENPIELQGHKSLPITLIDYAIEALEQQPCEDAISRARAQTEIQMNAFRYTLAKERGGMGQVEWSDQLIKVSDAVDIIRHLPSVIPQEPKTGHWIYDKSIDNWRCSECNETPKTMGYCGSANFMAKHFKFCNHCGVRMIES